MRNDDEMKRDFRSNTENHLQSLLRSSIQSILGYFAHKQQHNPLNLDSMLDCVGLSKALNSDGLDVTQSQGTPAIPWIRSLIWPSPRPITILASNTDLSKTTRCSPVDFFSVTSTFSHWGFSKSPLSWTYLSRQSQQQRSVILWPRESAGKLHP